MTLRNMTLHFLALELTTISFYPIIVKKRGYKMAIQKINPSFRASLRGDSEKIIKTAMEYGFNNSGVKKALNIINTVCPKSDDRVYLYYNLRQRIGERGNFETAGIRSGVKVAKDGVVLEKNVDPRGLNPKYLLYKFAIPEKRLVNGEIQPDKTVKLFK